MTVAIVTDSTSDLPTDLANACRISVIPNIIVIGGRSLVDGEDISREEFYRRLPEMLELPTTATASPGSYEEIYERLLTDGAEGVLSIHTSAKLSGIFNSANAAAQDFGSRVHVIDSWQVSMGLGFQAIAAAEAALGGAGLEEITRLVEAMRPRVRLVAMLDTLEYIRRSGRVSWAKARLGNLLRLKPFVYVQEGEVRSLGQARSRSKGIARLKELLHEHQPYRRLAMLHTNARDDAVEMLDSMEYHFSESPLIINVTTVIGAHVGPNGLGFTVVQ